MMGCVNKKLLQAGTDFFTDIVKAHKYPHKMAFSMNGQRHSQVATELISFMEREMEASR